MTLDLVVTKTAMEGVGESKSLDDVHRDLIQHISEVTNIRIPFVLLALRL
jgi:hypothetical protein